MERSEIGEISVALRGIKDEIQKLEQLLNQAEKDRYTDCPMCQAEGEIWVRTGLETEALSPCPKCYGDGFVEEKS